MKTDVGLGPSVGTTKASTNLQANPKKKGEGGMSQRDNC